MRVTINPSLDIETLKWVCNDGVYEYDGPVALCKGASAESKALAASQAAFYKQVSEQQGLVFKEQQAILKSIQDVTMPILTAGPSQYGFTPEEDALLRTEIIDRSAAGTAQSLEAQELKRRQETGGAPVLTAGGAQQIEAVTRSLGGQEKAKMLAAERLEGYAKGERKYQNALAALSGSAGMLSPTSYTSAATGAGEGALAAQKHVDSQKSSIWSKILGGVIGAGTSFLTGGLSNITGGGGFFSPKK